MEYIMGPEIKELEAKIADYVGVKHCITCASAPTPCSWPSWL
jgi:dTDP-4-amino-4,6-dideoxygalactose transaminase